MTTRSIKSDSEWEPLFTLLRQQKLPVTVTITKGVKRTNAQNHLNRLWVAEIAEQLGDRTPEEVRGEAKLTLGVPILRAQNEAFRQAYDEHIRPLPYETKLAMMQEPLDWPVTRIMTTKQQTEYLDAMLRHYGAQGVELTIPDGGLPWRKEDSEAA